MRIEELNGLRSQKGAVSMARPLQVCACQMARYCGRDCQLRHWAVHKPVCKAARQQGGIKPDQALFFMADGPPLHFCITGKNISRSTLSASAESSK